jgi:hypothetical protein
VNIMDEERRTYMKILLIFFVIVAVLQFLDVVLTGLMIYYNDVSIEANPFMRFVFSLENGIAWAFVVKIIFLLLYFSLLRQIILHKTFEKKITKIYFMFANSFCISLYLATVYFSIVQLGVFHWL